MDIVKEMHNILQETITPLSHCTPVVKPQYPECFLPPRLQDCRDAA